MLDGGPLFQKYALSLRTMSLYNRFVILMLLVEITGGNRLHNVPALCFPDDKGKFIILQKHIKKKKKRKKKDKNSTALRPHNILSFSSFIITFSKR